MTDLHRHYDELTETERHFVDQRFENIFKNAKLEGIPLWGNDLAEIAVDALARLVIVSRQTEVTP